MSCPSLAPQRRSWAFALPSIKWLARSAVHQDSKASPDDRFLFFWSCGLLGNFCYISFSCYNLEEQLSLILLAVFARLFS